MYDKNNVLLLRATINHKIILFSPTFHPYSGVDVKTRLLNIVSLYNTTKVGVDNLPLEEYVGGLFEYSMIC